MRDTIAPPTQAGVPDEGTRNLMKKVFGDFSQVPEKWLSGLISLLQVEQPTYEQVPGRAAYVPQFAQVLTAEDLTGTDAYANLATTGPEVTGLGAGSYVAFWSALVQPADIVIADTYVGVAVNGSDVGDATAALKPEDQAVGTVVSFLTGDLTGTTNSVRLRYRISDDTATMTFSRRNLLVMKVG